MALRVLRKNNQLFLMKIVVTGTRGIPDIMGGVETHCEELFPRIAGKGFDVTVIRRTNYVKDDLTEWKGVKLLDIESPKKKSFEAIVHTFRAINRAKKMGTDILHIHAVGPALLVPYAKALGMKVGGENGAETRRKAGMHVRRRGHRDLRRDTQPHKRKVWKDPARASDIQRSVAA